MYIVNPFVKIHSKLSSWSSTHPPTAERIRILRNMAHGVNYIDYQEAYSGVRGKPTSIIPPSGLKDPEKIEKRKPGEKAVLERVGPSGDIKYWRDAEGVHHVPKRSLDDIIIG